MKRDILDLWSLVMALIEYGSRTQLLVRLGPIYQLEISMVSPELYELYCVLRAVDNNFH